MAKRKDKTAERVKILFNSVNNNNRVQWEYRNQKGYDFSNDNQLTEQERQSLEDQGMPTFTINRITPVVEMLNFYATANTPRWQAIGTEGSDTDTAALFADLSDYIWYNSDGNTIYSNAINDSITKSIGYLMVTVDHDQDNGMGEVVLKQPEPFDIYVDPKSRDMLFKDAAFVMIRKILPKTHLTIMYPGYKSKIKGVNPDNDNMYNLTEKAYGKTIQDFSYKDINGNESIDPVTGERDSLVECYELYEKEKVLYVNVFYRIPPNREQIAEAREQAEIQIADMQKELEVRFQENLMQMQAAVEQGKMLKERFDLEVEKAQKAIQEQIKAARMTLMSQIVAQKSMVDNQIVTRKEYAVMEKNKDFMEHVVEAVDFYQPRIKHTVVVGDKTLFTQYLPSNITEYPIVPFHFKWTGTPYPISAVSPLVGKQRELNKAHQIMVHNASLGSSLRYMYEEGSVDTDYWEKYSSSPGALLPIRPGATIPTPIQPAPLSNAFFQIVQEGKGDMEYLAGIYSSMMGDTGGAAETYRGMLALDEYGTRRIKQWMKSSIEPALKQLGTAVMQFSQAIYSAEKVFRVVQPNNVKEDREVSINIPIYNDYGEVIDKFHDYQAVKFDVRIVAGSTLPINRWAYLEELKQLMQLGVVDDIAVLAETDIRNKEKIAKRKSMYSQMQGQIAGLEESMKDKEGTIETLERQLVQAGIKGKVMAAEMEITKRKEQEKAAIATEGNRIKDTAKLTRQSMKDDVVKEKDKLQQGVARIMNEAQLEARNTKAQADMDAKQTRGKAVIDSEMFKNHIGNE